MAKEKKLKKEKKTKEKKQGYLKSVFKEMKNVSFPSKKEVVEYTIATIVIVILLVGFFIGLSALLSWVKEVL